MCIVRQCIPMEDVVTAVVTGEWGSSKWLLQRQRTNELQGGKNICNITRSIIPRGFLFACSHQYWSTTKQAHGPARDCHPPRALHHRPREDTGEHGAKNLGIINSSYFSRVRTTTHFLGVDVLNIAHRTALFESCPRSCASLSFFVRRTFERRFAQKSEAARRPGVVPGAIKSVYWLCIILWTCVCVCVLSEVLFVRCGADGLYSRAPIVNRARDVAERWSVRT